MASGRKTVPSTEKHHVLSNKNSKYAPQYKEITDRYNMTLDQEENIIALEGHHGRHTNAYHEFMLTGLMKLDSIAAGDIEAFYEGFKLIVEFLEENTWLPYAK